MERRGSALKWGTESRQTAHVISNMIVEVHALHFDTGESVKPFIVMYVYLQMYTVYSIHIWFCFHLTWFAASTCSKKGAVWICLLSGTSHLHLGQIAKISHCPCHCEWERNISPSDCHALPCYIVVNRINREEPSRDAWRVWFWWKFRKRLLKSASCTLMSLNGARATASKIGSLGARVQSVIKDVLSIFDSTKFEYQGCLEG